MKKNDDDDPLWHRLTYDLAPHTLHYGHIAYFAAVSIEGHGLYAILAGVLCVLSILNAIFHFE